MAESGVAGSLSIVIPAKNEAGSIGKVVELARALYSDAEVIVIDDGSSDGTGPLAESAGATVVRHPVSLGNGAAIKTGARVATKEVLVLMDGDGQHDATEIAPLLQLLDAGYDMAVGARVSGSHANVGRFFANGFYSTFASLIAGSKIPDLTSGFRAVRTGLFRQFLYLLPNGFSYPTTITMAFLRSGYPVGFTSIKTGRRQGKSHIRPLRDGVRFLAIIFKIATLYSPLKVFMPVSGSFFMLGVGYYLYTYVTMGRFTNMSLLIFGASVIIFLIGLVSEQITTLMYSKT